MGTAPAVEGTFQLYLVLLTGHCFPSIIFCGISWFHSTTQYVFKQPAHFSELITQPTHSFTTLAQGQGTD